MIGTDVHFVYYGFVGYVPNTSWRLNGALLFVRRTLSIALGGVILCRESNKAMTEPVDDRYRPTQMQHRVLEWVANNNGRHAVFPQTLARQTLRDLVAMRLVAISISHPPKYRLTGLGRAIFLGWNDKFSFRWFHAPAVAREDD